MSRNDDDISKFNLVWLCKLHQKLFTYIIIRQTSTPPPTLTDRQAQTVGNKRRVTFFTTLIMTVPALSVCMCMCVCVCV